MAKKKSIKEEVEIKNENIAEVEMDVVQEEAVKEEDTVENEVKEVVEEVKSEEKEVVKFTTIKKAPNMREKAVTKLNFGYAWNGQNFD